MTRISIDPITRLEGHGKIEIFLDEQGNVANCYFQVPELRGFEIFCVGRPVEEMPFLTSRICGVCPEAHLMAAAKACDAVYKVEVPPAGKKLRELLYMAFYVTDHTTHFYALGGPDFVVGPEAPAAERNILGVIAKVGLEIGGQVIDTRKRNHHVIEMIGGRPVHPVAAIPGGMSHPITEELLHVDFLRVDVTQKMVAEVPIVLVGEAPAVGAKGGTLIHALHSIEVESLPMDLPASIQVDISKLDDFEKEVRVRDIPVNPRVVIRTDGDELVARVNPPVIERVAPAAEEAEEAEAAPAEAAEAEQKESA